MSEAPVAEADPLLDELPITEDSAADGSQYEDGESSNGQVNDGTDPLSSDAGVSGEEPDDSVQLGESIVAQEDATQQNSPPSRLPSAVLSIARKYMLLVGSCSGCLILGTVVGYLVCGQWVHSGTQASMPDSADVSDDHGLASMHLLGAIGRRSEPLKPLVAFHDLDSQVVELGRRLFHEQALSGNGRLSCASCHDIAQGGTIHEALPRGVNRQAAQFNAPSVLNVAFNFAYGWQGRFDTLEEQVEDPITRPDELGSSWERVLKYLNNDASYKAAFKTVFDSEPTKETVATALATFERSLVTSHSKFDQWLAGDEESLNGDEFGGYFLFKKYGCINCHQGAVVGGTMFQPLGFAKAYFPSDPNVDPGRMAVTQREKDRHSFRVAPLRNVALTAPYLHDGRAQTLEEAVAVMLEFQCGETVNAEDVRRLVAFLNTLSGKLPDDNKRFGPSGR